jgi:dihydrodipicolinate synthase/N-acetylneuraminate lyase
MQKKYHGVVVPMITPFGQDKKPDVLAIEKICNNCAQYGVSILSLGTTGESPSVSTSDSRAIVSAVSGFLDGRVSVYACLTGNSLYDNIENAKAYIDAGADVIVSILPNYYKINPDQMYAYYWKLADSLEFPLMIYNIPAVTNMSIPLETVQELSRHPYICGLKDSERDEQRILKGINMFRDDKDFSFFAGYAAMSARSLKEGADGIIPSTGNLVPSMFSDLYRYAISGNHTVASRLQKETDEIACIYQKDRNLGESLQALKVMMSELGLCETYAIPPLQVLDNSSQEAIREATRIILDKYNIKAYSEHSN